MDGKTLIVYSSNEISEVNIENIKKALGVDADVAIKIDKNMGVVWESNGLHFTLDGNSYFVTYDDLTKQHNNGTITINNETIIIIKAKEIRSSLDGLTFDLSVRRNGKTRKVIDNAINILYEDGRVLVQNHDTEDGVKSMRNMNDMLAKLIWKRLVLEDSRFKGISTEFHKHYKNGILTLNHTQ